MRRPQRGFTCHPCMGAAIGLAFASSAAAVLVGDLRTLPGAPEGWFAWMLLGTGFVLYLVVGFATQELIFFFGVLGIGLPWAIWWLLQEFGAVGPLAETAGRWAWYVLYAHALAPVLLGGAFFLWMWLRSRKTAS